MKLVKFDVSGTGAWKEGSIIDAVEIANDKINGYVMRHVIYIPPSRNNCACFMMVANPVDDVYKPREGLYTFVNATRVDPTIRKVMKDFLVKAKGAKTIKTKARP